MDGWMEIRSCCLRGGCGGFRRYRPILEVGHPRLMACVVDWVDTVKVHNTTIGRVFLVGKGMTS